MLQDPTPFTQEQLAAVAAKLQAFYETLEADEQLILQALLLDWCGNANAAHGGNERRHGGRRGWRARPGSGSIHVGGGDGLKLLLAVHGRALRLRGKLVRVMMMMLLLSMHTSCRGGGDDGGGGGGWRTRGRRVHRASK